MIIHREIGSSYYHKPVSRGGLLPHHHGDEELDGDVDGEVDEEVQPRRDGGEGCHGADDGGSPRAAAALGGGGPLAPLLPW